MASRTTVLALIAGDENRFSLEHRIFNTTSLFIVSFGILGAVANYFLGLHPVTVWLSLVGVAIASVFYYRSRITGDFGLFTILAFVFASIVVLAPIHFFNGGLQGNVIYLMIMLLNIFLLVIQRGYQYLISSIYYITFITLLATEYLYPELIFPYRSAEERYLDHAVTMSYSLFYTAIVITVFRKNYDHERNKVKEQYEQMKVLNLQIDEQLKALEKQKQELADAVLIANEKNEKNKILLRELNHRVKNNLQVVSSLLNLQSQSIGDDLARAAILESKNRLVSMVLVHQRLYHDENSTRIFMPDYIKDLGHNIMQTYSVDEPDSDAIRYELEPIILSVEQTIPIGLICNEVITNFFKHVYIEGQKHLSISMKEVDGYCQLSLEDNGSGFDQNAQKKTFGLRLIKSLVKQIGGEFSLQTAVGTRWIVQFHVK